MNKRIDRNRQNQAETSGTLRFSFARQHSVEARRVRATNLLALYGRCVYAEPMARMKERWDFRVASETDHVVRQAAETAERTLTEFVVDAAVVEAERVLADRTQFVLEADQWDRFVELLDRSPQEKPGVEKLFSKPSVFTAS
jgi:uncharacterized protein (DUF1778 family)